MERPAPPMPRFSFTGLNAYVNRLLRRLANGPAAAEMGELHRSLLATSRRLEMSIDRKQITAGQFTPKARELRGWLAFLADEQNLAGYVAAVSQGPTAVEGMLGGQSQWKPPVRVYLRPIRGMYRAVQQKDGLELSLPIAAVCFDESDWQAIGRCLFTRDRAAKRHVLGKMQSEVFQAIAAEIDALGGEADEASGRVYDLQEVFERMNAAYFGGAMQRPRLSWSRSLTFRKFGHYDWIGDAVVLSRTLDAADVPAFVVDFVMYHEMLHKAHGLRWTANSSRGYAHTAAFYRDEKRFARHAEAEAALSNLAQRQRRR